MKAQVEEEYIYKNVNFFVRTKYFMCKETRIQTHTKVLRNKIFKLNL
jgi:hypothetical protein